MNELLLTGGRVLTMDPARPRAEAVLVRGERIAAVGSVAELSALASPASRRVDLAWVYVRLAKGKNMLPREACPSKAAARSIPMAAALHSAMDPWAATFRRD